MAFEHSKKMSSFTKDKIDREQHFGHRVNLDFVNVTDADLKKLKRITTV